MLAYLASIRTAFTDPANARKTWWAFVAITVYLVKHFSGLDLGEVLDPIVEAVNLLITPLIVFYLPNAEAKPKAKK